MREELRLPSPLPPLSVIGVDFLFEPDVLFEVEAYAILDWGARLTGITPLFYRR